MAFDPATLLSRTSAGDAELRTPQNGLSLGQRKLLTFLEQPQALEEFASRHGFAPDKLERDLAKLASLGLVAINGETSGGQASTVVLGGLRGPSAVLRYALMPVLLVGAAIVYFVIVPGGSARKPATPAAPIAGTPAMPSPTTPAAPSAAPSPAPALAAPDPLAPALAAAIDVPPRSRDTPSKRGGDVRPAPPPAIEPGTPQPATREAAPLHDAGPAPAHVAVASDAPTRDRARSPLPAAPAAPASATVAAPAPAPAPAVAATATPHAAGSSGNGASNAAVNLAAAAAPATASGSQAAATPAAATSREPAAPTRTPGADPMKLAMAAPSSADAHPPAKAKLLPIARADPEFPREAIVRGVAEGTVKALLAIDAAGQVTAVRIVDARPSRVFDRAVKEALARWTFPAGDAGRSTEVEIAFRRN